jgi:hypothetical protein
MISGSPRDIAAVCCLFNPCGYRSRLGNYHRFRAGIAASKIPLLTVELAFDEAPFELMSHADVLHLRGGDVMWQKEQLLQIGAERLLAQGYRKIAFLDADILFDSTDWPTAVSRALDRYSVVQCFSDALQFFANGANPMPAGITAFIQTGIRAGTAKGLAWAMRSEVIEAVGLYPHCVVGSGDSALFIAVAGMLRGGRAWREFALDHPFLRYTSAELAADYHAWGERLQAAMQGAPGFVSGRVVALAHGSLLKRRYHERHRLLAGFDPAAELSEGVCGALRWTRRGRTRAAAVAAYFRGRNEDAACSAQDSTLVECAA